MISPGITVPEQDWLYKDSKNVFSHGDKRLCLLARLRFPRIAIQHTLYKLKALCVVSALHTVAHLKIEPDEVAVLEINVL